MAEGDFPSETLKELRDLLGTRFDEALPWLQVAVGFFLVAMTLKVSAKVRQEIKSLADLLEELGRATNQLSPKAVALLNEFNDLQATNGNVPFVTVHQSLVGVAQACERLHPVVKMPWPWGTPDSLGMALSIGVASALACAGVPLSKGRDGVFARVLTVVWHGVDPTGVPQDTFRYVREAAAQVLLSYPGLRAGKGRPRSHSRRRKE